MNNQRTMLFSGLKVNLKASSKCQVIFWVVKPFQNGDIKILSNGIAVLQHVTSVLANPDAKRLYDDLLRRSGYNKHIRPVHNLTDKLIVSLGLRLSQLIDLVGLSVHLLGCYGNV